MNLFRSLRQSLKLVKWLVLGISLVLGLAQGSSALNHPEVPAIAQLEITRSPVLTQLMQQGKDHYQAGQFTQAITVWQQAEAGYQQQGDDRNRSLVLSNLSAAHQQLGQWREAEQDITKSLQLLQSHPDRLILAQALNTQASLVFAQGQMEQAIDLWKQAASLYPADEAEKRSGALLNQAQAQQSLGLYLQAKQTLSEIERLLQTQPDSVLKVVTLRSLGDVLRSTGNLEDARRVLDQSLAIAAQFSPAERSATLISLGNVAKISQIIPLP
ncbi:MAG: tetratricopeptide repeat protein [Leptolyngbyaceae cyanobacterium CSU_1_4]|nr:tetratricopeptide repeat protein [Leptolyngbyaceae cyanobacterium CSU_1_4]